MMALKQHELKVEFVHKSARVKSLDAHPTKPWVLSSLHSGTVYIWNYQSKTIVNSFEVTGGKPVRCARFLVRKDWVITGADDEKIRIYNYNTGEKTKEFKAHDDYIRCLAVHPNLPYVLSSSDDQKLKLWDFEKDWVCIQTFEGHNHYVMQAAFNPKDPNSTFVTASLDSTAKIWSLDSHMPVGTLHGHSKGVNCITHMIMTGDDGDGDHKICLLTGSDDRTIKVWDHQSKSCLHTLEGHTHNVTALSYHPRLQIIISGSEDGTLRVWDATTFKLVFTLQNHGLGRVWTIEILKDTDQVIAGCDEGIFLGKLIVA